ncbi:methyltransferase domain-containing protein [Acutalibacter sp. 1XD8-33]|uniref:TRM11 family SAM-dependent methyltransferase n=1 Tax=Acutalibacter sp. 1XD8-33 TaxID=2320081 RepID=UPI000EA02112|nr:methyltransferase domain-containing protein [Acutalibacter sp. 1XD8-33]RKJ41801.1 methyltransferase domain-containing protein [Acutalibacter sp. 1XD8-33]
MRYFGQFIPGAEPIVREILLERLGPVPPLYLSGGAVEFETPLPYSDLNLFCFHNLFQTLYVSSAEPSPAGLEKFLRALPAAPADWTAVQSHAAKCRSFRLVASCKNQLTAVSPAARSGVEKKLRQESGLKIDRSLPDSEFWALVRGDGQAYFLKRLSRHRAYDKLLHPGELHPQLAHMMCWLARPKHTDLVLDPFCGYGAIPQELARRFPFARLCAFDLDPAALKITREKLPRRENILVEKRDALRLAKVLPQGSVHAVVTDPPWGLYQDAGMELGAFYREVLAQLDRILAPDGRIVLLTAAKRELEAALEGRPGLTLSARYDILVSGKKCGLFLIARERPASNLTTM